jgi:hypothetical protein
MKRIKTGIVPLALFLTLAACGQPGHRPHDGTFDAWRSTQARAPADALVTLTTNSQTYPPGDAITLSLANRSRTALGYNLCRASVDRKIEDDWREVQATLSEVCTAELRTLYPGQSAAYSFRTDRVIRRGQYRIRSELVGTPGGARVTALSNSFMIQGNDSD